MWTEPDDGSPYCQSCDATSVLVTGIDFGATHSCIAWARYQSCAEHHKGEVTLTDFSCSNKFPTVCLSKPNGSTYQLLEPGDKIPPSMTPIRNFKLLLPKRGLWENGAEETARMWKYLDDTTAHAAGDDALAVSEYLDLLWKKAMREAPRHLPGRRPRTIKGVVTYPACFQSDERAWEDFKFAKNFADFRGTTAGAGVDLMTEHDAALRAALTCGPPAVWYRIWTESPIIVIDCGGMSTDGILYRLSKTGLTHSEPETTTKSMLGGGLWADELIQDIDAVFATVIDAIVHVATSLWEEPTADQKPKTVLLIGGLSKHPGVIKAVESKLRAQGFSGSVQTFKNAWNAVAIGAALKDLPVTGLRKLSGQGFGDSLGMPAV